MTDKKKELDEIPFKYQRELIEVLKSKNMNSLDINYFYFFNKVKEDTEKIAREQGRQDFAKEVKNEMIELSKKYRTIERRWFDLSEWLEAKLKEVGK